ncbi:hypothetical protein KYI11_12610 (plasmid) [Macrococcoides bohemicum]|uniref:HTH merR-type domain-containing protein n=1 Tax=Macrococcoides bohemicum TaxID=1903056 RepID=A0AAJ4TY51_9STAP|nr:MerR family transcriptional regulator [Macrococcus bohemicus]QYA43647.1 hypothetical protein KYI11_12610 [Macrococcus bohemicus]
MDEKTEYFSTKDIIEKTGLTDFTLRKYVRILEATGWNIERNKNNNRIYNAYDFAMIEYMLTLINTQKMTIEDSAQTAYEQRRKVISSVDTEKTEKENVKQLFNDSESIANELTKIKDVVISIAKELTEVKAQNEKLLSVLEDYQRDNEALRNRLIEREAHLSTLSLTDDTTSKDNVDITHNVTDEKAHNDNDSTRNDAVLVSTDSNELDTKKEGLNSADHTSDVDAEPQEETPIKIMAVDDEVKDTRIERMRKESEQNTNGLFAKIKRGLFGK